jgi:hypothetical protein
MGAAGPVYEPSSAVPVEARTGRYGHDQIYLTLRVSVVRSCHLIHIDDIDTESIEVFGRLDDTSIFDAARLPRAHPTAGDCSVAGSEDLPE